MLLSLPRVLLDLGGNKKANDIQVIKEGIKGSVIALEGGRHVHEIICRKNIRFRDIKVYIDKNVCTDFMFTVVMV